MRDSRHKSTQLFGNSITHPLNLILIFNCFVFILQHFANEQLVFVFGLIPDYVLSGKVWQVFTYGFLHSIGNLLPLHLLFNMYGLYMLGTYIIPILGKARFVQLYFFAQLGGGLLVLVSAYLNSLLGGHVIILDQSDVPTIGASGAVFGLLAVFGQLYPNSELFLLLFRVKAKNAVWVSLGIGYALTLISNTGISNTCHLGGALVGLLFFRLYEKAIQKTPIPSLPGLEWESREEVSPVKRDVKKETTTIEDLFLDQKKQNENLLNQITKFKSVGEVRSFLSDKQVASANICPPSTYNPEDPICLRCEWLPNCALRKTEG
ncbi:MAG: rhomboid family intramembrane serine protease [Leptospira sp.]|nr:rhomboid family intramembrane serine protease [Leptospira sp.]